MGTTDRGIYLPAQGETGWATEVNDNLSRLADLAYNTAAFASIQAAIDAAEAAGGGIVLLPEGTHSISTGLTVESSNVYLYLMSGAVLQASAVVAMITLGTAGGTQTGIGVLGPGKIDGNALGTDAIRVIGSVDGVHIKDVEITGVTAQAIDIDGAATPAKRINIEGCHIHDVNEGILWTDAEYVLVRGNHIEGITAGDAIEPFGSTAKYWVIEGNTIDTTGQSGIDVYDGTSFGVVQGNVLRNCGTGGAHAIALAGQGVGAGVADITVEGNVVDGTSGAGIRVNDGTGTLTTRCTVRGNIVRSTTQQGIHVRLATDTAIIDNWVSNCQQSGIDLNGPRILAQGNTCINNDQVGGGHVGIRMQADRATVINNHCYDNQGASTQQFGIQALGTVTNSVIEGNTVYGNTSGQISNGAGAGCVVRRNFGFITEFNGVATVASGTTSIAVNHGLVVTPALDDISVTPTNNLGNATKFWISGPTATQFTINVDADPGAGTATFAWKAAVE